MMSGPTKAAREEEAKRQIIDRQRLSKRDLALCIMAALGLLSCAIISLWWYLAFASH